MENLIGRFPEIKVLKKLIKSTKSELLAIYGRRRIGKTFLITKFFRDKGHYFEMIGIKHGSIQQQLRVFSTCLKKSFISTKIEKIPQDWFEAFEMLEEAIENHKEPGKIILFFDEFPWMDTHRSDLLKAFEFSWNSFLSRDPRIITILCGSSVSWMIRKIIRNRGGLHGRLTAQIRLRPFTLRETESFFASQQINLDRKQIVEVYMAIGGVPKYLSYVEPGKSSAQIIQSLCFDKTGPLVSEFDVLYESLFDNYQFHVTIIELLALHRVGLTYSQISDHSNIQSGGSLSKALKELVASDFVQFIPFFGKKKKEGRYCLVDEYSFFFHSWMQNAMYDYNKPISPNYWIKQHSSNKFKSWSGYVFETMCYKHVRQIVEALKLSVQAESAAYWSYLPKGKSAGKGAQIDLIIDRSDQCINLCEIKFYNSEYIMQEEQAKKMNNRREIFRQVTGSRKTLFNTLITPYGANVNRHTISSVDQQLTLDALFLNDDLLE